MSPALAKRAGSRQAAAPPSGAETEPRARMREPESSAAPARERTRSSPPPPPGYESSAKTPAPASSRRSTLSGYERKPFFAGAESEDRRPSAQTGESRGAFRWPA